MLHTTAHKPPKKIVGILKKKLCKCFWLGNDGLEGCSGSVINHSINVSEPPLRIVAWTGLCENLCKWRYVWSASCTMNSTGQKNFQDLWIKQLAGRTNLYHRNVLNEEHHRWQVLVSEVRHDWRAALQKWRNFVIHHILLTRGRIRVLKTKRNRCKLKDSLIPDRDVYCSTEDSDLDPKLTRNFLSDTNAAGFLINNQLLL